MITGVGTDLVEIARVQKAIGRSAFLEKVYTEKERELIAKRPARAAGNFAAKEAVAKALGCGFAGIAPREIEVLREASGLPFVVLHGRAKKKAEELGVCRIQISITDTAEYAQSYAVCEKEECTVSAAPSVGNKRASSRGVHIVAGEACFPVFPVLDGAGMKSVDRATIEENGVPSLVLMERAAIAVTDCVKNYVTEGCRVGVLCGTGNNGGDGVAVARMLAQAGVSVAILVKQPEICKAAVKKVNSGKEQKNEAEEALGATPEFLGQLKMAEAFFVPICSMEHTKEYDIIVDALFGIGLTRNITGEYAKVIEKINAEEHKVIAVDIPSGISADTGAICGVALRADETVTFGAAKVGHLLYPGKEYTGGLTVDEIGFPKELLWRQRGGVYFGAESVADIVPKRPAYSNKGTFGKVVVVAGSKDMAGAAYFSACAAYRMGAGLVKIATPECNREILQTLLPEAMLAVYDEKEEYEEFVKGLVDFADAIVIGPGLGQSEAAQRLVKVIRKVLCELWEDAKPSVWDADGLNIIAAQMNKEGCSTSKERVVFLEDYLPAHAVITPHLGELSRLTGKTIEEFSGRLLEEAKQLAEGSKLVYV